MEDFRIFRPTYTDKATGNRRLSPTYHIVFRDHLRRLQRLAGFPQERPTVKMAIKVRRVIEHRQDGSAIPDDLMKWMDSLDDTTRRRLSEMEIIDPAAAVRPLVEHLDGR